MKKILLISILGFLPSIGAQAASYICPASINCNVGGYPPVSIDISCTLPSGWTVGGKMIGGSLGVRGNFKFSFTNAQALSSYNQARCNYVYFGGNSSQYYSINTQAFGYLSDNNSPNAWQPSGSGQYCYANGLSSVDTHDPSRCPFLPASVKLKK